MARFIQRLFGVTAGAFVALRALFGGLIGSLQLIHQIVQVLLNHLFAFARGFHLIACDVLVVATNAIGHLIAPQIRCGIAQLLRRFLLIAAHAARGLLHCLFEVVDFVRQLVFLVHQALFGFACRWIVLLANHIIQLLLNVLLLLRRARRSALQIRHGIAALPALILLLHLLRLFQAFHRALHSGLRLLRVVVGVGGLRFLHFFGSLFELIGLAL